MEFLTSFFDETSFYSFLNIAGFIGLISIGLLVLFIIGKTEQIKDLKETIHKLKETFEELDEQAKLIVKTDLELNKAQEELDRRLKGLYFLQKISRLISTTLVEDEIFQRLKQPLSVDLSYERYFIVMYDDTQKKLNCRLQRGFTKEELIYVVGKLRSDKTLKDPLQQGHPFSSLASPKPLQNRVKELFGVENFILVPILTQDGITGIMFFGNHSPATPITEGDEELLSILASQIGQSLENARLFEQVYQSRLGLEANIQERTQQLTKALEDVKRINRDKTEFVSAVSHELRTPLTSIKGYASILMTGKVGKIPPEVHERLSKINKHSDNLVQLINNLLDISRIESGRVAMHFEDTDLKTLIDNVHDLLTPQMREKDIAFIKNLDEDLPVVSCDRRQIERVLINLVGNAVKFTPKEGSITVEVSLEENHILVKVIDTGIGIKEEDQKRLFNEFYRVDNEINLNVKGTGLGLPLAKKIVEAHQGQMGVSSLTGQGSTFYFTVPLSHNKKPNVDIRENSEQT
jgi:signal transduction histidine kinase